MHFLLRAKALVVFPGGYGTLDELFDTLTLMQTKKIKPMPILLFGRDFWRRLINFDFLVEQGMITEKDLQYIQYVEPLSIYPTSVQPERKISVSDVMAFQRSTFEGTIYDKTEDYDWYVPDGEGGIKNQSGSGIKHSCH